MLPMENTTEINHKHPHWETLDCVKFSKYALEVTISVALLSKLFFEEVYISPRTSTVFSKVVSLKEFAPFLNTYILLFELAPKMAPTKLQASWKKSKLCTARSIFKTLLFSCVVGSAFFSKIPVVRQLSASEHLSLFLSGKIFAVGLLLNTSRSLVLINKIRNSKIPPHRDSIAPHTTYWMKTALSFTQASYPVASTAVGAGNEFIHGLLHLKHLFNKKNHAEHSS
jgi:hypothetical protein